MALLLEAALLLVDEALELLEAGLVLVLEVFEEDVTALATVVGLMTDEEEVFLELEEAGLLELLDDEVGFLEEDVTVEAFVVTTLTSVFKVVFAVVFAVVFVVVFAVVFFVDDDFLVEDDFLLEEDFLVEVVL